MFVCAIVVPILSAAQFATHTVADDLKGGYQVVAADVNHDGKMDLIALASGQTDLIWYENPNWERHIIASNMKSMINLAYWNDQIVLASQFANEAKRSIGVVSVLVPDRDVRQLWNVKQIDKLTTSHRLRWADVEGNGRKVLINAPLTGEKAEPPEYRDHAPLVLYRPGEWKRELISNANEGVQHGILVLDWDGNGRDSILTASFSGIHLFRFRNQAGWQRTELAPGVQGPCPKCGSSDVAAGRLGKERFLAAIEPWHGNELAIYNGREGGWSRTLIDGSLVQGHTIVTADLDGDSRDEIIVGFRGAGGTVSIWRADPKNTWSKSILDNAIPANSCAVADLNGDKRPDVVCIGGALLRWYENLH